MDYDHGLPNSTGNLSPEFGDNFAYAQSSCPERLYNMRSGPNSFVNLPYCISPQGPSFSNFSPRRHAPDIFSSQSVRHHPYHSSFDPYIHTGDIDFRRHATGNLVASDGLGGTDFNEKWFRPQINCQQNVKSHLEMDKEKYDGVTTVKPNAKRKRGARVSKSKNIMSNGNFPAQSIDNNLQTNYYDANRTPTRVMLGNVSAQGIDNNLQTNYYDANHTPSRVMLGNVSAQGIDNKLQTNYYDANHTPSRFMLGNVSAQGIDNNSHTIYDPNAVLNNVSNEVMTKNYFPLQSSIDNCQTNYNPDTILNNLPNKFMSKGNFPTQSIDINPQRNYYDPTIVPSHVPCKNMTKANFPAQSIDNTLQTNYDSNAVLNHVSSKEVSVSNKDTNEYRQQCSMAIEQNNAVGKYYSHMQVTEANIDDTKISVMNSNATEEMNCIPCEVKNADFNNQPKNDLIQRIFASTVLSDTDVSDIQSLNSLDLSDFQLTHITMPENSIFNIQDIRQENLENTDLSSYSFEPLFEGKDENGDDMVVLSVKSNVGLPATSNAQQGHDVDVQTCALVDNQNSEMRNSQVTLYGEPNNTDVNSETLLESQVQKENDEIGENVFLSHIDDYAAEEIVTTSKRKCVRTKRNSDKSDNSREKNNVATANQFARENYIPSDPASQPGTSRESRNKFTKASPHANTSRKGRKFRNFRFKQQMMPPWRRRNVWKYNEPIKNIQRTFFKRFMRRVRMENEHMMVNEKFWNLYRMIVNQIGSSVMETMYNILPAFIRNSEVSMQRSNETPSKSTKKRLQVKFPYKLNKQGNSGNL